MKYKGADFLYDIDQSWTLFLDRDGVINERLIDDYVKNVSEFKFLNGSLEAFYNLKDIFLHTIVVTNQQGIGKELMTHEDLQDIHNHMINQIEGVSGFIDQIYYAPQLRYLDSNMRKPGTGMAHQAKRDFPYIEFEKSIIVGDSVSDMQFGEKLGMCTVYINAGQTNSQPTHKYNITCNSLHQFALMVLEAKKLKQY